MEKILRKRIIEEDFLDVVYGKRNLSYLIKEFSEIEEKYKKEGYLYVSTEMKCIGYDGGVEVKLIGYNLETDDEFEKRCLDEKRKLAKESLRLKKIEEKQRNQFEKLKKKYGNN